MPIVNGKEYSYTAKGMAMAKKAMKKPNKKNSSSKVAGSFNTSNKPTRNIKA